MTNIFKLSALNKSRYHWQCGMESFECLNAGHFIQRDYVYAKRMQQGSRAIHTADLLGLLRECDGILRCGIQPALATMRTKIRLILKNDRPAASKWRKRSRVGWLHPEPLAASND